MSLQKYADMTNEQRVKYEKAVGIAFREEQGITNYVTEPLDLPKHSGDTVNYRTFNLGMDKTKLAEGVELPEVDLSVNKVTVAIGKYGAKAKLTEELMYMSIDDLLKLSTPEIGKNFKELAEELAFAEAITSTNTFYTKGSDATRPTAINQIDATNYFTYADAQKIGEIMRTRKVPAIPKLASGAKYVCLITPAVATRLMQDERWVQLNQFGNAKKAETGSVGVINNVEFIQTTFVPTGTDGAASAPNAKCVCIGGKSFGGVKMGSKKNLEVWYVNPEKADPNNRNYAILAAKMWDAYKLLRSEGVMVINTYNG